MKHSLLAGFGALALGVSLVACASSSTPSAAESPASPATAALQQMLPETIRERGTIVVGTTANNPPFSWRDGQQLVGLVPDLAELVEQRLGVDLEFSAMNYPGLTPALQAGKVDLVWSMIPDNANTEQSMDMLSYLLQEIGVLVPKGNPQAIASAADLCGLDLATVRGGNTQQILDGLKADCDAAGRHGTAVSYFDDSTTAQTQMKSGNVDVFMGVKLPIGHVARSVDAGAAFEVLDLTFHREIQAIAFKQGEREISEAVAAALEDAIQDSSYAAVLSNYDAADAGLQPGEVLLNPVGNGQLQDYLEVETR